MVAIDGSWIYNHLCNQCLSPLKLWVWILLIARCTLCDKVYQWLAICRWFSAGTPVSSTNKTGSHDITEILLKVASNTITLLGSLKYCRELKIILMLFVIAKYSSWLQMTVLISASLCKGTLNSYPLFCYDK
jgi:hypothetical protein